MGGRPKEMEFSFFGRDLFTVMSSKGVKKGLEKISPPRVAVCGWNLQNGTLAAFGKVSLMDNELSW